MANPLLIVWCFNDIFADDYGNFSDESCVELCVCCDRGTRTVFIAKFAYNGLTDKIWFVSAWCMML